MFVGPFLLTGGADDIQCDVIQFISGIIFAAGTAVLTYYGRLVLDRTKISTISGVGGCRGFSLALEELDNPRDSQPRHVLRAIGTALR